MEAKTKKHSKEFDKFEALTRKLVSVPKKDIQEREKQEQSKKAKKN